jgi:cell division protein ZapA
MKEETVPVTVKILEKDYRIACASNHKESLEDSAALLNDKMLEIRSSGKVIGSDRIAVMAALNLAHDLLQQQQQTATDCPLKNHLRQLREKIDGAVNESKQMELG